MRIKVAEDEATPAMRNSGGGMTKDERRKMRNQKKGGDGKDKKFGAVPSKTDATQASDNRFAELLLKNEDELLQFVAQVNHVYQEKLKKNAPFMTFVFCGMQSSGKSTIMERFLNSVLNIVQEGTGTRCPLDTTCIHDDSCIEPRCDLSGSELDAGTGKNLTVDQVFERITSHNRKLAQEDRFSTESLRLVYRSSNVQNMRFVDTPGIISNKSTGKDNRKDIQDILRSEMRKPNTKLCVLLEPKEFATNPIVDFCDGTFGSRDKWIDGATFLMTKFDKQLEDSRTASKANTFFKEFHSNNCFPHLVITPTLPKEDLPPSELFTARRQLLDSADAREKERFLDWQHEHHRFNEESGGNDEPLNADVANRIGFHGAKQVMREIMLEDTAKRLPEVLRSLREELAKCQKEARILIEKAKFNDPKELKLVVSEVLWHVERRIVSYLDGDLESALKFPEKLQTLEEELEDEDESEWASRELNHYSEQEDEWRDRIAALGGDYSSSVQADIRFLGGKQVQRAIQFFRVVMIEALPDPYELRDIVPNVTGYLASGLNRENWERAMIQITKVCVKDVSHPGLNFLIKHVGSIFRRLFSLALEDVKCGEEFSATFKLLPSTVEKHLAAEFDDMLWTLMESAAEKTHTSMEPLYSTVDPALPTFHPSRLDDDTEEKDRYEIISGTYQKVKSSKEKHEESFMEMTKSRINYIIAGSAERAKEFLRREHDSRATSKRTFLPDERTSMVTHEETDKIIQRAFEYIVALLEFSLFSLTFNLNHFLYQGFKTELSKSFKTKLINDADWDKLVESDPNVTMRLEELKEQIVGLADSLREVERMQRKMS